LPSKSYSGSHRALCMSLPLKLSIPGTLGYFQELGRLHVSILSPGRGARRGHEVVASNVLQNPAPVDEDLARILEKRSVWSPYRELPSSGFLVPGCLLDLVVVLDVLLEIEFRGRVFKVLPDLLRGRVIL
jgi:hypothetical protein